LAIRAVGTKIPDGLVDGKGLQSSPGGKLWLLEPSGSELLPATFADAVSSSNWNNRRRSALQAVNLWMTTNVQVFQ
jgi:hypothetical protein